jgi:OOP family OmpA-OmpF porin
MKSLVVLLTAVVVVLGTATVSANVEVGGTAGLHTFSEDNALGDSPNKDTLKDSALFAGRLGVYFGPMFGVEAEAGMIESEPKTILFDVWNITYRASVVAQFRANRPNVQLLPFVIAGAGVLQVVQSNNEQRFAKDSVIVPHIGGGAKYRTGNGWGVRLDLRLLLPPKFESGITMEYELLFGLYREYGQKKIAKKEEPKVVPKDEDPDKDGISGAADKCPNDAEDKDGFEDDDGCPEPDNDKDGIADGADKCPTDAEDKDGFEDDDGCPDLDNDKDGFPDKADKCPDKAETKNGFEDDDGCPDEVPEKLQKFTGVIKGITFKVGSTELAATSTKILDEAVAVLVEFKTIKLEIQGHTDDQPLTPGGKFADNTALSQARAESVKAYFVKKGVEDVRLIAKGYGDTVPVQDPKGLAANKLDAARNLNRRVEFKLVEQAAPAPAPAPTPAP